MKLVLIAEDDTDTAAAIRVTLADLIRGSARCGEVPILFLTAAPDRKQGLRPLRHMRDHA